MLVQVNKFYYLVDFMVLDTDPLRKGMNSVMLILRWPFLVIAKVLINWRNEVMQLSFGNMILGLIMCFIYARNQLIMKSLNLKRYA